MGAIVELTNVVKSYARGKQMVEVLRRINLKIEQGEFVALTGASGSGKTTLLNLVGGLDRPTSGDIVVAGEYINRLQGSQLARWRARHVGVIFQFYNLLAALSAERNVEVPLLLTGLSGEQRRRNARAALKLVDLADRTKHKPRELSGGQQQRVAIARALVADPTLLICDEPTGDLDRHNSDQVLELLQALNRTQGKTIIMVTHDPRAASHATRQIRLDKGSLVLPGETVVDAMEVAATG